MTVKEWIRKRVLKLVGLSRTENLRAEEERLTFINNDEQITRSRIREYNIWYCGDGDELLNYYTHQNTLEYNFEPWYSRNKKNYFWSISSTESDIKRTHSGQPRNIVDTLVAITKFPLIECLELDNEKGNLLTTILKEGRVKEIYKNKQMPLTLVEGWGCYKINWDMDLSDYPYPIYYRAENVEFIYKADRIVSVVFKDYYTDGENKQYLLTETRSVMYNPDKNERYLDIEKNLFSASNNNDFVDEVVDWSVVPELKEEYNTRHIIIDGYDQLLAVPCIFFENTSSMGGPGRSIFTGKIDLFDDLDQCLSQNSNAIRKSTPTEYFNTDFLERNPETGLPIQPKAFDRKYTMYAGQKGADGSSTSIDPVQVTQPQINFTQYTDAAIQILMQIVNGVISPATIGIDISKRDNAEAQREKEKVTIFTRNCLIDNEETILRDLCDGLLCAYQLMTQGQITRKHYDVSVKFSEFADDSYENKLEKLGAAYDNQFISDEMFMQKLYGQTLSRAEYEKELNWIIQNHTLPRTQGAQGAMPGEMMGGMNDFAQQEMEDARQANMIDAINGVEGD